MFQLLKRHPTQVNAYFCSQCREWHEEQELIYRQHMAGHAPGIRPVIALINQDQRRRIAAGRIWQFRRYYRKGRRTANKARRLQRAIDYELNALSAWESQY